MDKRIDARGLPCPEPVIITQKALVETTSGVIVTIVDNEISKDNIIRLAESQGFTHKTDFIEGCYHINIYKEGDFSIEESVSVDLPLVLFITSNTMGRGSKELGEVLIRGFFYALSESPSKPRTIIFVNGGVNLTCDGSEVIEYLLKLEKEGVEILSCGTCLDYFNLKGSLLVGHVSNMYTILEKLSRGRVVNIG